MADYSIGILLSEGFDDVSALIPHAVLHAASDQCAIDVTTYSLVPSETVAAASGLEVVPDDVLIGTPDLVFVPGGRGGSGEEETSTAGTDEITDRVATLYEGGADVAAVSSGVALLGEAGLLDGRSVASERGYRDAIADHGATVEDSDVVDDGRVLTGAGPATGFDIALRVIERECGPSTADTVAQEFEIESRGDVLVTEQD